MKIAFVYFTYRGDADLLELAVKAANMRGDNVSIVIVDDYNNPLDITIPCDHHLYTTKNRGGNLKNKYWLTEEFETLSNVADMGFDWVVKIDSDTVFNKLDLPDPSVYDMFYARIRPGKTIFGPVMGFTKKGLMNLSAFYDRLVLPFTEGDERPDDNAVTLWIDHGLFHNVLQIGVEGVDFIHGYESRYTIQDMLEASAVDFKAATWKFGNKEKYKDKAVMLMKFYIEALTEKNSCGTVPGNDRLSC